MRESEKGIREGKVSVGVVSSPLYMLSLWHLDHTWQVMTADDDKAADKSLRGA